MNTDIIQPIATILVALISGITAIIVTRIQSAPKEMQPDALYVPASLVKKSQRINAKVILLATAVGGIIGYVIGGFLYTRTSPDPARNFPFEATVYDFENVETDGTFWFSVPKSQSYKSEISQEFAHSRRSSLRLSVDMQSAATNPDTEYTGIGLVQKNPFQAKAIVAWVYIPASEPIQNISFKSHILAYVYKTGENLVFLGEEVQVKPGIWTPLYIGSFGETKYASNHIVWNGQIDELYLTIWSDKPYNGSIYIDDLSIYE